MLEERHATVRRFCGIGTYDPIVAKYCILAMLVTSLAGCSGQSATGSAVVNGHLYVKDCAAPTLQSCNHWPLKNGRIRFILTGTTRSFDTQSDASGAYSLTLVSGSYSAKLVFIRHDNSGRVTEVLRDWDWGPRQVLVASGQRNTVDFAVIAVVQ